MTNTKLLRQKIEESGYRVKFVAEKIGITYQALLNKLNNETDFKAGEMKALQDLLHIEQDEMSTIFFS